MRSMITLRRTRATALTITTALGVPAAAVAATSAQAGTQMPAATLALNAPHAVRYGAATTVTGTAAPSLAGRSVALQATTPIAPGWHQMATATIDRLGHFRFRLRPRRSVLVRAVEQPTTAAVSPTPVTGTAPSAATAGASAISPVRAVTVAARLNISQRQLAVLGSGMLRVAGQLLPAAAGRLVRLQGRTGSGWSTLATGHTGHRGRFALRAAARRDGQALRVVFSGDRANGAAVAHAGRSALYNAAAVSWYDDAGMTGCGFHAGYGVASRTLPCGTRLTFVSGGRSVTATVDDRGPYVYDREFDLNQNTAAALGFSGVGTVWVHG
jgi:rare lipoprotein A